MCLYGDVLAIHSIPIVSRYLEADGYLPTCYTLRSLDAAAQVGSTGSKSAPARIAGRVDQGSLVKPSGHMIPSLTHDRDLGAVENSMPGGTSLAAPELGGVFALLVAQRGRQGLVQPALYALAKAQYTAGAACFATGEKDNIGVTTKLPASSCIFNDVTTGNIDISCKPGSANCFTKAGGVLGLFPRTGATSLTIEAPAGAGYGLATGLGSVNIANLIRNWSTALPAANFGDNTIGVLTGKGDGTFNPQVTFPSATTPYLLSIGDLNGDGKPDFVVTSFNTANFALQLGTQTGVYTVSGFTGAPGDQVSATYKPSATDAYKATTSNTIQIPAQTAKTPVAKKGVVR